MSGASEADGGHVADRCENCGAAASWQPAFANHRDLRRCLRCSGWEYTGDFTSSAEELYGKEYFQGGEYAAYEAARASHARNFQRKLRLLERHGAPSPRETRLLEVGCATGEFLDTARRFGIVRALGLEVSAYCRDVCRARGHHVLSPEAPEANLAIESLRPNLIVAWDVWEHLRRPASTFDGLLDRANPELTIALTTVDAGSVVARWRGVRWRQFHPPTHLHYPTRRSLRMYLEQRGFTVTYHRAFGYYRPLLEYLRVVGVRARPSPPRWLTLPVFLDLMDIQLVIARRGMS